MERDLRLDIEGITLEGNLNIPMEARGLVIFAHGSGSSRLSPRNHYVAGILQQSGLATLLFDLLTAREDAVDSVTAELRFNIPFLAGRLTAATDWVLKDKEAGNLNIGYFGASTGAAAALAAAAERPKVIRAIVSRGGRPDLAGDSLPAVRAPVLLIVGGLDTEVIELNQQAMELLTTEKEMAIVSGASHLFEEPGTLRQAAKLTAAWFTKHLV